MQRVMERSVPVMRFAQQVAALGLQQRTYWQHESSAMDVGVLWGNSYSDGLMAIAESGSLPVERAANRRAVRANHASKLLNQGHLSPGSAASHSPSDVPPVKPPPRIRSFRRGNARYQVMQQLSGAMSPVVPRASPRSRFPNAAAASQAGVVPQVAGASVQALAPPSDADSGAAAAGAAGESGVAIKRETVTPFSRSTTGMRQVSIDNKSRLPLALGGQLEVYGGTNVASGIRSAASATAVGGAAEEGTARAVDLLLGAADMAEPQTVAVDTTGFSVLLAPV